MAPQRDHAGQRREGMKRAQRWQMGRQFTQSPGEQKIALPQNRHLFIDHTASLLEGNY